MTSSRVGPWPLVAAILGSSLAMIDGTAVNVALPVLGRDFNASAIQLQWVIEGYSLFLSALILVGGSLGDRYGRRAMFALGVTIFAVASLACGFAPNIGVLIVARCIQGVGGALATPESLALITACYGDEERGSAIGTWSAVTVIAAAAGPLLGGWLAQAFSWRYVFFINIPIAVVVLLILERRVPESRDESAPSHIDVAGATLATLGLGLLIYGLISLQESFDWRNVSAVVLGVITLIGFLFVEARSPGPMMRLDLFSSRVFSGTNLYTFLLYAALGGSLYFVPFYLINIHGYSPAAAGAALLPTLLLIFGFSRFSGGLVPRIGARPLLVWGALLAAAGFVAYGLIGVGGSYWTTFFPAAVLLGLGGACFVAPLTTAVMESVPPQHAGIASGVNNAIARAAGLVAIAVLGIILAVAFNARFDAGISHEHLSSATANAIAANRTLLVAGRTPATITDPDRARVVAHVNDAYASGFRAAMFVSAALAASAALVAFVMLGPARVRAATASAS